LGKGRKRNLLYSPVMSFIVSGLLSNEEKEANTEKEKTEKSV
jgi:hypothetical protein